MKLGLNLAIPGIAAQQGKVAQRAYHRAVFQLDARRNPSSGAPTDLSANALAVQNGSAAGADENDALFLPFDGERYVYLPGLTGNYLSAPDEAALDITGDIDIRCLVAMDDWTPSASSYLVAKRAGGGQDSYEFFVNTNGTLRIQWYDSGTAGFRSASSTVAPTVTDGAALWVRAALDADNGASGNTATFYTSTEGTTWTQLGTSVVTATVAAIAATTATLNIGAYANGTAGVSAGKFYAAQVRNGIDGPVVFDWDANRDAVNATHTSYTASTGQTWTVNRATSGRKTVVVEANKWLLGTNDYIEVAHHPLLNFDADDNFTVLAIARSHHIPAANARFVSKRSTGVGWAMGRLSATGNVEIAVNDGTWKGPNSVAITNGAMTMAAAVRSNAAANVRLYVNAATSNLYTDPLPGDLSNTVPVRIGAESTTTPASYHDMELYAVYIWREALTASELAAIAADWGAA